MGTYIRPDIITFINSVRDMFQDPDNKAYLTGGALCEHQTNDLDILLLTSDSIDYIDTFIYKIPNLIKVIHMYSDQEDRWHTIAKCLVGLQPIDLLVSDAGIHTISSIMDDFPLSIQMRSLDLDSNELIYGDKFCADPIIVFDHGTAEDKYRKYYPDINFVITKELLCGNKYLNNRG